MPIRGHLARECPRLEALEDRLLLSLAPASLLVNLTSGSAAIRGYTFDDLNGDGTRQHGEPGLPGRTVFLDHNANSTLDENEPHTVTGVDGGYSFTNLPAGTYIVQQVLPAGWVPTSIVASARTVQSSDADRLIRLDKFRADRRFKGIDGSGFAVAVLDTGIAPHSAIDPDRIVYQHDFLEGDAVANDEDGHGTHIASLIASQSEAYPGVAPGADLIVLRVLDSGGTGSFATIEKALQWVLTNANRYHIGVVNLSLGDGGYHTRPLSLHGIGNELAALAARNITVVSAAGNEHTPTNNAPGVAYPAADPNVIAVGAVWDSDHGGPWDWDGGATDQRSGPDRIVSFSQRVPELGMVFAPGTLLTGAAPGGGTATRSGSSAASALVSGVVTLAQQLAKQRLGRPLTTLEIRSLLASTGSIIHDGDDEEDNVAHTDADYRRIDVQALGEAILALGSVSPGVQPGSLDVQVPDGKSVGGANLGSQPIDGNHAPVLIGNGQTSSLREDSTNPTGVRVGDLLGTSFTDMDANSLKGIAVIGVSGSGRWQYSLDDGQTWLSLGGASRSSARLLGDNDRVRFLPLANFTGNVGISYLAWDQTIGTPGQTVNLSSPLAVGGRSAFSSQPASARFTITSINDAPILTGAGKFTRTLSGQPSRAGDQVATLLARKVIDTDISSGSAAAVPAVAAPIGMAIVGATGQGRWQFSHDGGRTWLALGRVGPAQALLLASNDRIRFVPAPAWRGVAQLTYRAWDQTTNRPGDRVDLRGRVGGTTAFSAGTTTAHLRVGGAWVGGVIPPSLGTVLARLGRPLPPGQGIAVVAATGPGRWEYSFDTRVWYDLGPVSRRNARLLPAQAHLRYVATGDRLAIARLSYQTWNGAGRVGSLVDPRRAELAGQFGPGVWTVAWPS